MKKITIILVVFLLLFILTDVIKYPKRIRPIKISVVNSNTGKPIEGLLVYYEVYIYKLNNFMGIPLSDCYDFNSIRLKKYTDENGSAHFPERYFYGDLFFNRVNREYIYINLNRVVSDTTKEFFNIKNREKEYYHPNGIYKGAIIFSNAENNSQKDIIIEQYDKYNHISIYGGLLKESEIITVELEPITE